jgi:hypothetical protein
MELATRKKKQVLEGYMQKKKKPLSNISSFIKEQQKNPF